MAGLKADFILETFQEKAPHHPKMSAQEPLPVTKEVETMLKRGAIQKASVEKGQFLRNLISQQTFEKLKNLNALISYLHFTMEGLHLLKDMLKEKD